MTNWMPGVALQTGSHGQASQILKQTVLHQYKGSQPPNSGVAKRDAWSGGSPSIDRPGSKGKKGEPQDAEADGVAGPVAVDGGLQDPLTAADEMRT